MSDALTETEARVLWSVLNTSPCPRVGYDEYLSGLAKLGKRGRGYSCRDCPSLGTHASHYGGFVCAEHKAAEDRRFADAEYNARLDAAFRKAVTE